MIDKKWIKAFKIQKNEFQVLSFKTPLKFTFLNKITRNSSLRSPRLTLDSKEAWKFIPKNLLHTSVYFCFRPKQLLFVKISEITIRRKMTYFHRFHRVPEHKRHFWRRIRVQRKNLPRNPYSIRLVFVIFRWHSYFGKFRDFKIQGSRYFDN